MRRIGLVLALCAPLLSGGMATAQQESEVEELRRRVEALEAELGRERSEQPAAPAGEEDPLAPTDPGAEPPADGADTGPVQLKLDDSGPPDADGSGGVVLELPKSIRLRIDGQIRWRGEYRGDGYAQPKTNNTTDFIGQRTRLAFEIDAFEDLLGARVVLQDTRLWGDKADGLAGARLSSDQPELMLYEGYAVLRNPWDIPLEVKVGRMEVPCLGDQRLISSLDWSLVGRSWDGAQVTYQPEGWFMTAFATNIREASALPTAGDESDDVWFVGAYVSNRMIPDHELDLFFYWRKIGDRTLFADSNGNPGSRTDYTFGGRVRGKVGPLGYGGFIALQLGDQAGDTIAAWAAATDVSVTLKLTDDVKLKLLAEYAFASGDPDPTDSRVETFDSLFHFAHYYNGHQDLFAWRNLHSTKAAVAFWPVGWLSLHSDLSFFWLDRRDDRWYGLGFTRNDPTGAAGGSYVGAEIDTYVKAKVLGDHLSIWAGYSHFFPGEYVRDTGPKTSQQDWLFLMATVDF